MSGAPKRGGRRAVARHPRPRLAAAPLAQRLATLVRGLAADEAQLGLDAARARVLFVLGDGGARSVTEAAAAGGLDPGRAARSLQTLARSGHLERTHDAFDARRTLFRLSARGRALCRRLVGKARIRERSLLASLSPVERRQFDRLLAKLLRAAGSARG